MIKEKFRAKLFSLSLGHQFRFHYHQPMQRALKIINFLCAFLSLSPSIIIEKSKLSCCWYSMLLSECDFFYFALHVETWHIIVDCIQDQVVYAHERKKFFKRSFVVISINYTPTWWWSWSWVIWLCLHIQLFWGWLSSLSDDCLEKLFKKKTFHWGM